MTDNIKAKPAKPGLAHEKLNVFIGKWHAEGESYAVGQTKKDPRGAVEKWVSDETYEWLPGKFFVMQQWDAKTGQNPFMGTVIINRDADTGKYTTRSYENHGFIRDYVTTVDGDTWTFDGDTERARIEFTDGALVRIGRHRRVAATTPYLLAAPQMIVGTTMILHAGRRLAERFADWYPVKVLEPPLAIAGFAIAMVCHPRNTESAAHCWLRQQLLNVARRCTV